MSDGDSTPDDAVDIARVAEQIEVPHPLAEELSCPVRDLEKATVHLRDLDRLAGPLGDIEAMSAPFRRIEEEMQAMTSPAMLKIERAMAEEAERTRKMTEAFRVPLAGFDAALDDVNRRRDQITDITRRAEESARFAPEVQESPHQERMNAVLADVGNAVNGRHEREEKWRADSLGTQRAIGEGIGAVSAGLSDLREATGELVVTAVAQRKVAEAQAEALRELAVTGGAQAAELERLRSATEEAGRFWSVLRTQAPVGIVAGVASGLVILWVGGGMPTWGLHSALAAGWAWLCDQFG